MNNFDDLGRSSNQSEKLSHDFFVMLLDQLFGQHDNIRIDSSTENTKNHEIIHIQWRMIKQHYSTCSNIKKTKKLVRQTLLQITNYLNQTYKFKNPILFEPKRQDFYDSEKKRKYKEYWAEIKLNTNNT
jgi:hypothetical protein